MANCKECKEKRATEKTPNDVPYIVHESAMARNEKNLKRLVVALIVAISFMFASNAFWLYAWIQYDYSGTYDETVIEAEQDGSGVNIVGGGYVDYGSES